MSRNTKITYLYRDASNYKMTTEVILKGEITEEGKQTILDNLEDGEYFIPRQVGLPENRFEELTEDDHCYFELDENSFEITDLPATEDMTVKELVEKFRETEGCWDSITYAITAGDFDLSQYA